MAWRDIFRWGRKSASNYDVLRELSGLWRRTASGKLVNVETAIGVSAVFACARVISNGMAQVPTKLMLETVDAKGRGTRKPARDHPLYRLLAVRPNPWQTAFQFRTTISWHVELAKGAFVFKSMSGRGEILELIPLDPGAVTVKRADDFSISYEVRGSSGASKTFPADAIMHIRGPSWSGFEGLEIVRVAREAIGLSMATEESQAAMHRNGVKPSGLYSVEGVLNEAQYASLRKFIIENNVGPDKAGDFMLLDREAKWTSTQQTGVDAQHLETRREQIAEVCRFFGVFPIMAGYSDKAATFASAESMFLAHVVHCLSPRWTMYEQSFDADLLSDEEREAGYYFDHVEEGMIRGSIKDTKDAILGYVNGGVMTPNEGRAKLDLNPDDDPASDELRLPVNVAQAPEEPPESDTEDEEQDDEEPSDTAKAILELAARVEALASRPLPEIKVDARTNVEPAAVTVNLPEMKASDVRVDVAPPAVHVAAPEVNVKAYPRSSSETFERDDKGELKGATRINED